MPHSVDFLDSLPKTGTGKILKRELRKRYGSEAGGAEAQSERGDQLMTDAARISPKTQTQT